MVELTKVLVSDTMWVTLLDAFWICMIVILVSSQQIFSDLPHFVLTLL